MKKFILLTLMCIMTVFMCACGNTQKNEEKPDEHLKEEITSEKENLQEKLGINEIIEDGEDIIVRESNEEDGFIYISETRYDFENDVLVSAKTEINAPSNEKALFIREEILKDELSSEISDIRVEDNKVIITINMEGLTEGGFLTHEILLKTLRGEEITVDDIAQYIQIEE